MMNDIVASSRVRLARNVQQVPFPSILNDERAFNVVMRGVDAACDFERNIYIMKELSEMDKRALIERHFISTDLAERDAIGAVIISKDKEISVMVNEEDHVRAQCIKQGLCLAECYGIIDKFDDALQRKLPIAFDSEFGYLTSCITNLGTGMRASVMMFLPALTITKRLGGIFGSLKEYGITHRGVYGEGSAAEGCLYQISNSATLGVTEEQIINTVTAVAKFLSDRESEQRQIMVSQNRLELTDAAYRAYGLLSYARVLNSKEFMEYVVSLKLGMALDLVEFKNMALLDELILCVQPGNLCKIKGKELNAFERDLVRAEYVRTMLSKLN